MTSGFRQEEAAADADLARRIARGEDGAFEQLVTLYQPRVAQLAYRLMGWEGEVEDVVQDVFLAAFRNAAGFRRSSTLNTWLTAITLNRCRSHHRRQQVRRKIHGFWRQPSRSGPPSDRPIMQDELAGQVRTAVAALPLRDREVIVLHYLEHKSAVQISELIGGSRNAIEVRLHRARARLREALRSFMKD